MSDFKVNDNAYFEEPWTGNVIGGKIAEIGMTKATEKHPSEQFVIIKIEGTRYDKRQQLSSKCYPTREAALDAQNAESERIRDEYRNQIQDCKDLVAFMYDHHVSCCEEYTDWNARAVAKEKAKDLLGLELD